MHSGGNGSVGTVAATSWGGGGGGGGGNGSNGSVGGPGNGTANGGAGGTAGAGTAGGKGGTGWIGSFTGGNGSAGTIPGGGGGGGGSWHTNVSGGAGAAGQVKITYVVPLISVTNITPASGCAGSTITIDGVNLSNATAITVGGTPVASITSNTATQIIAVLGNGTSGVVSVTNSNGTASSATSFTVLTAPAQPSVVTGSSVVCANSTNSYSVIAASDASSYTWSLPGSWTGTSATNTISATADNTSGTISVIANNACGNSTAQTFSVSINVAPLVPDAITGAVTICDGSSMTYAVTNDVNATGYTWTLPNGWSGTSTTNSLTATANSSSGTISVVANNICGASPSSTVAVTGAALPTVTVSPFASVCSTDPYFTLTGGSPAGGNYSGTGVSSNNFDPSVAGVGSFTITYTYFDGTCSNKDSASISVTNCSTGIGNFAATKNVNVYPNPFKDLTTVSLDRSLSLKETEIRIYDVLGKEVMNIKNSNSYDVAVERKDLQAGVFFLKVINNNSVVFTAKLVIE